MPDSTICAPACKARAYSLIEGTEKAAALAASQGEAWTCARSPICEIDRALMEGCMNRRNSFVMIALLALVAGAAALVYARHDKAISQHPGQGGSVGALKPDQTVSAPPDLAEVTETGAVPGQTPKVLYDFNALPEPVKRMLKQIAGAAESGDIETMRPVFESNELKPMVTTAYVEDPIAFWKKASADGTGRDVLAAMLNILSTGFVRMGQGKDETYVWPYFAETDLVMLTPPQEVELYRIVPPALAFPMKRSGKYAYYRLGISSNGVWQYFIQ
jgi:hypothetical protein